MVIQMIKINGKPLEEILEKCSKRFEVVSKEVKENEKTVNLYVVKDKHGNLSGVYDSRNLTKLDSNIQKAIVLYIINKYHKIYGGDE